MKTLGHTLLALALAISTLASPRQTEATVAMKGTAAVIAVLSAAHVATAFQGANVDYRELGGGVLGLGFSAFGWYVAGLGVALVLPALPAALPLAILILDEDFSKVQFKALDIYDASDLSLTESQRLAFNSHVDIFNLIANDLESVFDQDSTLAEIAEAWTFYLNELNVEPEAREALGVLTGSFLNQLQ